MVRKVVKKRVKEMPKSLKFVYGYNIVLISLFCIVGIVFFFLRFALGAIIIWVLAYISAMFFTRDLRRGKSHAYWLNLVFSLLAILNVLIWCVSLNGAGVAFLFEIIVVYCLLRKDSRDFFK